MLSSDFKVEEDPIGADDSTPFAPKNEILPVENAAHRRGGPTLSKRRRAPPAAAQRTVDLNLPFIWKEDGLPKLAMSSHLSVASSFPVGRDCTGHVSSMTRMRGRTGYSTTNLNLQYHATAVGVLGGLILTDVPKMRLDISGRVSKTRLASKWTVCVDKPSQWGLHLQSSTTLLERLSVVPSVFCQSTATLGSYGRPAATCKFTSRTRHPVELTCACLDLSQPRRFASVAARVSPSLSDKLACSFLVSWRNGGWDVSLTGRWLAKISTTAALCTSVALSYGKGLLWTFIWQEDSMTIRIPITIATTTKPITFWGDSLLYSLLQSAYLSVLSQIVCDVTRDLAGPIVQPRSLEPHDDEQRRKAALEQQQLMQSVAKRRTETEAKRKGLVILYASYYLNNTDNQEQTPVDDNQALDVTIPLQFWVTESRLYLAASSKASLIGFCPLVAKNDDETPVTHGEGGWKEWWAGFIKPPTKSRKQQQQQQQQQVHAVQACLVVEYEYAGKRYHITVSDDMDLEIPNEAALPL